ncbi:hypothetical protein D6827_01090 [Candidatus Parcubacteria bacterium]|nr:MAG: hypothetical protein D6827_01090 [Candidatus Parcubacteria bacterium]
MENKTAAEKSGKTIYAVHEMDGVGPFYPGPRTAHRLFETGEVIWGPQAWLAGTRIRDNIPKVPLVSGAEPRPLAVIVAARLQVLRPGEWRWDLSLHPHSGTLHAAFNAPMRGVLPGGREITARSLIKRVVADIAKLGAYPGSAVGVLAVRGRQRYYTFAVGEALFDYEQWRVQVTAKADEMRRQWRRNEELRQHLAWQRELSRRREQWWWRLAEILGLANLGRRPEIKPPHGEPPGLPAIPPANPVDPWGTAEGAARLSPLLQKLGEAVEHGLRRFEDNPRITAALANQGALRAAADARTFVGLNPYEALREGERAGFVTIAAPTAGDEK